MKKIDSTLKSPPTAASNKPLQPNRTITPFDWLHRDQFYAPSYQEQKAIAAMAAGKGEEAMGWYDKAILDDPERGHRIYCQSADYQCVPCQSAYSFFCSDLRNIERMKTNYRQGLLQICYRNVESAGESYKKARPMCDELMKRVHIWDNLPPPQYMLTSAPSVAVEQTKLKRH